MSEYIVPEQDIWKLPDGKVWEGVRADLPVSQADIIAKAGKVAHLKEQGWKKAAKKAAPAKKKAQKPAENKAAKVEKKDK